MSESPKTASPPPPPPADSGQAAAAGGRGGGEEHHECVDHPNSKTCMFSSPGVVVDDDDDDDDDAKEMQRVENSEELMSQEECLCGLGPTADGLHYAFLEYKAVDKGLPSLDVLLPFRHLRKVDVSGNGLTSVRELGRLQHLIHLSAARNRLVDGLDLEMVMDEHHHHPVPSGLEVADLSHNLIARLRADQMAHFPNLRELDLSANCLVSLHGISALPSLTALTANNNNNPTLSSLDALAPLSRLLRLSLARNAIPSILPLAPLLSLQVLQIEGNCLETLAGIGSLEALSDLNISHNAIASIQELRLAKGLTLLRKLQLGGNPMAQTQGARLHTQALLPWLEEIDGQPVDCKEVVWAANAHGADLQQRHLTRRSLIPFGDMKARIAPFELDVVGRASWPWHGTTPTTAHSLPPSLPSASASTATATSSTTCSSLAARTSLSFEEVDKEAATAPAEAEMSNREALCFWLCHVGRTSPMHRMRAIYTWVKSNSARLHTIPALHDLARPPSYIPHIVEEVGRGQAWKGWAKWVSAIFEGLASACGLRAESLCGFVKGPTWEPGIHLASFNHFWSAVCLNAHWWLVDVAWAVLGGPHDDYFCTPPEHLIYDHFPDDPRWQMLKSGPITEAQFWRLPQVTQALFRQKLHMLGIPECTVRASHSGSDIVMLTIGTADPTTRLRHSLAPAPAHHHHHHHLPISPRCRFSQTDGESWTLWTAVPSPGLYVLQVLAAGPCMEGSEARGRAEGGQDRAAEGESGDWEVVMRCQVDALDAICTGLLYAHPFPAFHHLCCTLHRPWERNLRKGATCQFQVVVPEASSVRLALSACECDAAMCTLHPPPDLSWSLDLSQQDSFLFAATADLPRSMPFLKVVAEVGGDACALLCYVGLSSVEVELMDVKS